MKKFLIFLVSPLCFLFLVNTGDASLLNAGFETGDFTGWDTIGNVSIVDSSFGTGPPEGNYQALLTTGEGAVPISEIQTFLGRSDSLFPGFYLEASAIKTSFEFDSIERLLNPSFSLSFAYNLLTNSPLPAEGERHDGFPYVTVSVEGQSWGPTLISPQGASPPYYYRLFNKRELILVIQVRNQKGVKMKLIGMKIVLFPLLATLLVACASGSAIVTGTKRTPIDPSQVKLHLEAPAKYEVIGIVNASSDAGWTEQGSQDYAIQELKNQAAKLGANGVLLASTGEKTSTLVGSSYGTGFFYTIPVTAKTVSGKAIFVSE